MFSYENGVNTACALEEVMGMDPITDLFDYMDAWRHLPNYQLERRADLFFALYLPEVLEAKFGFTIRPEMIPEFPVRIGAIYPNIPINRSCKIDYLALSTMADKAIFVELKTGGFSRRAEQDEYLIAARDAGLPRLLEGVLDIFRATNSKRKYFCLLEHIEGMGLLRIPMQMREIISRPCLLGINEASLQATVTARVCECLILYIQPNGSGPDVVSFKEFATVVQRHDDPISQRFARSLLEWAEVQAGERLLDIV